MLEGVKILSEFFNFIDWLNLSESVRFLRKTIKNLKILSREKEEKIVRDLKMHNVQKAHLLMMHSEHIMWFSLYIGVVVAVLLAEIISFEQVGLLCPPLAMIAVALVRWFTSTRRQLLRLNERVREHGD